MINKKYYNYDSIIFYKHCYFMNKKKQELIDQLSILEQEHKDLDEIINRLQENKTINLFQIQRLKKRKLHLKDRISAIKDKIEPDIIA